MPGNVRTLSSAQTFMVKFVFPVVWIAGFGFGTAALWFEFLHGRNAFPPPPQLRWIFLAILISGSLFHWWLCMPLKRVRRDDARLLVSNYRREISVPFGLIERISENRWINIHPVTIYLRKDTEFGDTITFMPKARIGLGRSHPVVQELNALIEAR
jgi:hypothetical protein